MKKMVRKKKNIFNIIILILLIIFIVLGILMYFNNNNNFKNKNPKIIEISKTYGGTPDYKKYKINLENKKVVLKKWNVHKENYEVNHSLSKKEINDIKKIFSSYKVNSFQKENQGVFGGVSYNLSIKFYDGTKLKIYTYGNKNYLKGDNKKLFDSLLKYVEKIFEEV